MSGSPNATAHVEPLLEAYHAGALPPEGAARVERHLRACAACRERSDEIAVYQIIRSAPAPSVGLELRQRLYARIAEASDVAGAPSQATRLGSRDIGGVGGVGRASRTRSRGIRLGGAWMGGAVAALIVALLASGFWALPRLRQYPAPAATAIVAISPPIIGPVACPPSATSVKLPANTEILDMELTSPTEGWAVGAVMMPDEGYAAYGVILRFHQCHWSSVALDLTGMNLSQIAMDSPTDGWAIGYNMDSNDPVLFHLSDGVWKQAPLPDGLQVANSSIAQVRAYAPGNIWLTAFTPKDSQGHTGVMLLLHLMDGKWSSVACPLPILYTVAPVGPNELWIVGQTSMSNESANTYRIAHYSGGAWSVTPQPAGAELTTLRAVSPTDVWASGSIPNTRELQNSLPIVAHYDGSSWQVAPQAVPVNAGGVVSYATGDGEGWAWRGAMSFTKSKGPPSAPPMFAVSNVWRETGGQWRALSWPYKDINGISSLASVSSSEFWAIGLHNVEVLAPTGANGYSGIGYSATILLHYANGVWTRYG